MVFWIKPFDKMVSFLLAFSSLRHPSPNQRLLNWPRRAQRERIGLTLQLSISRWGPVSSVQGPPFCQLCGLFITGYFRTESKTSTSLGLPSRQSSLESQSSLVCGLWGSEELTSCSQRMETPSAQGAGLSNKGTEL